MAALCHSTTVTASGLLFGRPNHVLAFVGSLLLLLVQTPMTIAWSTTTRSTTSRNLVRLHQQTATTATPLADTLLDDDDGLARSAFGTKDYWDDVYAGRGDFPADEYSWYYGWETVGSFV